MQGLVIPNEVEVIPNAVGTIKHKRLLMDVAAYTIAGYIVQPLMMVSTLLIRRSLGPYLAGVVATLTVLSAYSSYSQLGVLNAALRELPFCKGNGDHERYEHIRYSTFSFVITSSLFCALALGTWAIVFRSALVGPLFVGILIYALLIILQQWCYYYTVLLETANDFAFLGKSQVLFGIATSIANLIGVLVFGLPGLWAAMLLTTIASGLYLARRTNYLPSFGFNWRETQRLIVIGMPLLIMGLTITSMRTVDNLLVLHLLGTESLGLYTIALTANSLIFGMTNSLSGVLYPRMQEAYGQHQTVQSLSVFVIRPSLMMGLFLPVFIGGVFLGMPLIVQWLMPRFMPGLPAFKIIAVGTYFFAMFQMSINFLTALNKQLKVVVLLACALLVSIGCALLFTEWGWGLAGIASGTVIGYIVCFVGINSYALLHWTDHRRVAAFLLDLIVPIVYGALLLLLLDRYLPFSGDHPTALVELTLVKFVLFIISYFPLILLMERKTRFIAELARPAIARLLRRQAGS